MSEGLLRVSLFGGDTGLEVVGESHYQAELSDALHRLGRDVPALLVPEPTNPYDSNAVAVWIEGQRVGYLRREDASVLQFQIQRLMDEGGQPIALMGRIVGGEPGRENLGIWLSYDPEDFGLPPMRPETPRSVRTGESTHQGAWTNELPSDRVERRAAVRRLLQSEA